MVAPVWGRGRLRSFLHYGRRCGSEFRGGSANSSHLLPKTPGYNRFPGRGAVGIHPGLASSGLRSGVFPTHSSPFFEDVLCPKGAVRAETNYRSVSFEQTPTESEFQNGGFEEGCQVPFSRALGCQVGSQGCLPASPPSSTGCEVFWLRPGEKDLRLPSSPFWSLPSSLALYQGAQTCEEGLAPIGGENLVFPGRLPHFSRVSPRGRGAHQTHHRPSTASGLPHKLEEVSLSSPKTSGVFRCDDRPRSHVFLPPSGEDRQGPFLDQGFRGTFGQEVGSRFSVGLSKFRSVLSSTGAPVDKAPSVLGELPLLSSVSSRVGCDGQRLSGGPSTMGRQGFPGGLSSSSVGFPLPSLNDGCLALGLGRSGFPSSGARGLGLCSEGQVHQLARVEGHSSGPSSLLTPPGRPLCVSSFGQHDRSLLHQEAGLLDLSSSLVSFPGDSGSRLEVWNSPGPSTSEGSLECSGRQGLSEHSDLHGVVSRRGFISDPLRCSWYPSGGFDGDSGEYQTVQLRVPLPGQQGLGVRRLLLRLESVGVDLPFPSVSVASGGSAQTMRFQGHRFSRCPSVAFGPVVSPSGCQMSTQTSPQRGPRAVPMDNSGRSFPEGGERLLSSRLDLMKLSLLNDGFSRAAVDYFLNCHKKSTQSQYQSTWVRFLSFLDSEQVRPGDVRLCHVHNFLAREALVNGKAYRTVATYKCALSLPLKVCCRVTRVSCPSC